MGLRTLVLHLPAFRLERCGYDASEVAVLTAEQRGVLRIVALTPAAKAAGLREGASAAEARARCPGVRLEPWEAEGESRDRQALLQSLTRFSDRVFALHDGDFALAIGRTARFFGGEGALVAQARALVASLGHACRSAVADDPITAAALAGWGDSDAIVPPGGGADALAPLPIASLRPSDGLSLALATLGIERVGQWAALDPASVTGRFGEEGMRLHRIARGFGGPDARTLAGSEEETPIAIGVVLGGPAATIEPIRFALAGMLRQVSQVLLQRDRVAVRLALRLALEDGPVRVLRARVGRPTRDPEVLLRALGGRLEGLRIESPVVEIQAEVEESCPEAGWQVGLIDRAEGTEALEDLLARLADTLGGDALFSPERVDAWCPDRAWRSGRCPRTADGAPAGAVHDPRGGVSRSAGRGASVRARPRPSAAPVGRSRRALDPVEILECWERGVPLPRPAILLAHPLPVEVREEAGRPDAIHFERGWQRVRRAGGPEKLCGAWWSGAESFDRAYWVVELDQGTGWVFAEAGRWYWHGWFD